MKILNICLKFSIMVNTVISKVIAILFTKKYTKTHLLD